MWRALVFIGLLAVAAFGAVWLADRPGTVNVVWSGYEVGTSVAVAVVIVIAIAIALALLWGLVRGALALPSRWNHASKAKKRARGFATVSRGLVAVGAGDGLGARRHAREAERLLGRGEPLALLLKAQAAQIAGDRATAEATFREMAETDETRVLGLRGLFVEARRRGDAGSAQEFAAEAARLAPAAGWANDAVLEAQSGAGDWRGALGSLERRASLGLIDRDTAKRHRAVLLAAEAQALADRRDEAGALEAAQEAVKLSPDLVPAAALAGTLLARRGELRRAAKVIEASWKLGPHPDLADAYLHLRAGDSAIDRLHRAETLAGLSSWAPEARLTLARAALDARDYPRARQVIEPLLDERPTTRACLLMADLEEAEHGATGRTREWIARAARAPRDPAWIADGVVSDRWAPVSPVNGRLDAFEWRAPPDVLVAPEIARRLDDVTADLDERDGPTLELAPPPVSARKGPDAVEMAADGPALAPVATIEPVSASALPASPPVTPAPSSVAVSESAAAAASAPHAGARVNGAAPAHAPDPAVHAPDDPGAETEPSKPSRFKLFG